MTFLLCLDPTKIAPKQRIKVSNCLINLALNSEWSSMLKILTVFQRHLPSDLSIHKMQRLLYKIHLQVNEYTVNTIETEIQHFIRVLSIKSPVLALSFFRMFEFEKLVLISRQNSLFTVDYLTFVFEAESEFFINDKVFSKLLEMTVSSEVNVVGFSYYNLWLRIARERIRRFNNAFNHDIIASIIDGWSNFNKRVANSKQSPTESDETDYFCWYIYLIQLMSVVVEGMNWGKSLEKTLAASLSQVQCLTISEMTAFFEANKEVIQARESLYIQSQNTNLKEMIELILRTLSFSFEESNNTPFDVAGFDFAYELYEQFIANNKVNGQLLNMFPNALNNQLEHVRSVRILVYQFEAFPGGFSEEMMTTPSVSYLQILKFIVDHFKIGELCVIEFFGIPEEVVQLKSDFEVQKVLKGAMQRETLFGSTLYVRLLVKRAQQKPNLLADISALAENTASLRSPFGSAQNRDSPI